MANDGVDMSLYHHLSLLLLSRLHSADELIARDLLSSVVFNVDFLRQVFLPLPVYTCFMVFVCL